MSLLNLVHHERVAPGVTREWCVGAKDYGVIQVRADSLGELVSYVTSPEGAPVSPWDGDSGSRQKSGSESWDLGADWDAICGLARDGWPEGRAKFSKALAQLPAGTGPGRVSYADVAGGVLCVPTYVACDPCHFDDEPEDMGQAKVLRLLVPLSINCGVSASAIMNRGIAICSVIDSIEARGMQCEVECYSGHSSDHGSIYIRHRVKSAGDHLNPDMLATSIGHPATFRRINFAAMETLTRRAGKLDPTTQRHNYGRPRSYQLDVDYEEDMSTVHLPIMSGESDFDTPGKARMSIAKVFKDAGYELEYI